MKDPEQKEMRLGREQEGDVVLAEIKSRPSDADSGVESSTINSRKAASAQASQQDRTSSHDRAFSQDRAAELDKVSSDKVSEEEEVPTKVGPPTKGGPKRKGNAVRRIRIERMMSKAELARRANLSVLTVDRVEKGYGCRMDTKRKILEALGLSLADRIRVFGEEE